jgi:hypothetical protein
VDGGSLLQTILTKKQFLSACSRVALILPDAMWRELDSTEIASVRHAFVALNRVLYGGKTLPDRITKPKEGE